MLDEPESASQTQTVKWAKVIDNTRCSSLGVGGSPMALVGLMLYGNAYVQAGQSLPLA